jgi:hypothetical protein
MIKSLIPGLVMIALLSSISACSSSGVKPWERGNLAKSSMTFGADSMIETTEDHIYFSKEATSGGRSFGAGGCGCN